LLFIGDPAAIHVQRWLRYFVQAGHEVHLVPYPDLFVAISEGLPGQGTLEGVHVHPPPGGVLGRRLRAPRGIHKKYLVLENVFRARRLIGKHTLELVHAHYVTGPGWIGALAGFHPFVLTAWGSDVNVDPRRSWVYRQLNKWAIRKADLITTNSDDLRQKLIAMGATAAKVHVIQGGLEIDRFPFQRGNEPLRRQLGLKDELVVLSTRLLGKVYNLDILVKAIPRVKGEIPNVKFVFVYRGTAEQEAELKGLIAEVGAGEAVILIGPVQNTRMAEYYHLADVFVSIASSEGMPGSLTEAMACGAAPVVSDLPVMRDWIEPDVNGLLVPVRDVKATAQAIIALLRDPEKRAAMARRNRELVVEKADHRKWMRQVEEIYGALLRRETMIAAKGQAAAIEAL